MIQPAKSILRTVVLFVISSLFLCILFRTDVVAQDRNYTYDSINVQIDQHKDSTMTVTEELVYRFNGTYHAVVREISLEDEEKIQSCKNNPSLQCGGFEFLQLLEVLDNNGNRLTPASENETHRDSQDRIITPSGKYLASTGVEGADRRFKIMWVFSEEGQDFSNELFKFTVKYKVFGAPNYYDDYDLLYWNAIFGDREATVENVNVTLNYPGPVGISSESLTIPGHGNDYQITTSNNGSTVNISMQNLLPYESFTVLQKMPKGMIDKYAILNLDLDPNNQEVFINGDTILDDATDRLAGLPPGENTLEFSADGRIPKEFVLNLEPGEVRDVEVNLEMTREEKLKVAAIIILNVIGISFLPLIIFMIYRLWRRKGRDYSKAKVIVPEYSPPENVHPYLLGSLKDEHVDIKDITATIIDLAYRGYIKIKEYGAKQVLGLKIKKADFELIKLKEFSDLTKPERELMDAVFGTKDRTTTAEMKNKFYKKIPGIRDKIYEELVERGFFVNRPDQTRTKYIGFGFLIIAIAGMMVFASFIIPFFIGGAITSGVAGLALIFLSKYMPAKTQLGSDVFSKILGFKMYMDTAEKYRVQNLTPETFEKFLSYAVVFGIESQWAEKFKDIYKTAPDWYEGNFDTFSTIYLANSLSTFNTTTATAMTVSPSSSGSARGGGWSGGGGFSGGFSGGGGGGGGGGAW